MSESVDRPSWDAARVEAPQRPDVAPSLAAEPPMGRPRRLMLAFGCVLAAAAIWVAITVSAGLRFEEITETLTVALAAELAQEYEDGDLQMAVRVLLGAATGLGVVLTLTQVLSARACITRRSSPGRICYVVVTVLALPVVLFTPALHDGGTAETASSVTIAALLVVAAVLLCSPAASRWLRQRTDARPAPLTDLREDAEQTR